MDIPGIRGSGLSSEKDFRAKSTFGVAQAALGLLLPIAILNFYQGNIVNGLISAYVVALLSMNVFLVIRGKCHEKSTIYGLIVPGMLAMFTVFHNNAIIGSLWCFPGIIACYCMLSRRSAIYCNIFILFITLPLTIFYLPTEYSTRIGATLLAVSLFSSIVVNAIDQLNATLQQRILHDPLTGLLNRLSMKEAVQHEVWLNETKGSCSTLLAIDIDHFKSINDTYGHEKGDQALVALASIFFQNLRGTDKAFRTGGEEFLILMPGTGEKEANIIAERLRREIEVAHIIADESITISVGAAQLVPGEDWQQWTKRADNHLYEAKRLGRNRVTLSDKIQAVNIVEFRGRSELAKSDH